MINSRKWTAMAFAGLLVAGVAAGCGGSGETKAADGSTVKDGKPVLHVAMGLGEPEWKVMREDVFPAFEKANNVTIQADQVESADVVKKLEAMKAAKKMDIDVIAPDNMNLAPLVKGGLVEDLSGERSKIAQTVMPNLVKVGEFDGKLYFMPYRPNVEISFYNENIFKKDGLRPPQTWDELLNVAKTLKEKEGTPKVGLKELLDGGTTVQLFEFIRQAGGDPMKLNDEGSIKAYTFLKDLHQYMSPDAKKADWNTTNKYLANESFALANNWPIGVNVIVEEGGKKEVKAYAGWKGPVKASKVLGGDVLGIPAGAPNKDLAMKFIEYLMSKEVQETLTSKLAWPSSRTDAYGKVTDWQKPYFDAINQALAVAEPRPNVTYWPTVEKATTDAYREIVIDGKDVKATLDKYSAVIADAAKK